jgi:hypothetical protein
VGKNAWIGAAPARGRGSWLSLRSRPAGDGSRLAFKARTVLIAILPSRPRRPARLAFGLPFAPALALSLSFAGCAPADGERLAESVLPVVNGTYDTGDLAVVALTNGEHITCSGTLISSTVVVTAAHCVPPHTPYHSAYTDIQIYFGSSFPGGQGELVPVIEGWTHPGWNIDVYENDIALLRLAHEASVPPKQFYPSAIGTIDVDREVRVVGFGATSAQNPAGIGDKYEGTTRISELFMHVFTTAPSPSMTCGGDSGGPTFMHRDGAEVLVGVHSRADQDCLELSVETTVADYIDEILAFTGEPLPAFCGTDGQCASGCTQVDPDCPCALDGFCSEACTEPDTDADCTCAADDMCSNACPTDPDCEPTCEADGACDARCESDPDCSGDGKCDVAVTDDADCWTAGPLKNRDYEASSCSVARGRDRSALALACLVGACLYARARKRRRKTTRAVDKAVEKLQRI